jgi:CheY-like chemotaxis protein
MEKPKVLIVADEIDMRIFVSTLFSEDGYQAVVVPDGNAGLLKAREIHPKLIVLDVMIPGEGGVKMYQGLKTDPSLREIPVIMLSAVARKTFSHYLKMHNIQAEGGLPSPDAYMEKPPDAQELIALANRLTDSAKTQ